MAALNTIDTVEVRGRSEGLDKVASDLNKVADAHTKVGQASEGAAKVTDTSAKRQLSVANAFKRLTAQIDPAFRAQQQMARGQAVLDRALQQGVIDVERYAAALDKLRARYEAPMPANQNSLVGQTGNIAAQFNDIAVQLAGGQSPLLIALQQGTQISQVLGDGPGGARGAVNALGGAFMSLVSPVNLATIGIIALGGAAVQYLLGAGDDVQDLDEKLKRHSEIIRGIRESYGEAAKGLEEYAAKSGAVLEAQLRASMDRLSEELENQSKKLVRSVVPVPDYRISSIGTVEVDLDTVNQVEGRYQAFADAVARLREEMAAGQPDIRGFQRSIAEVMLAAGDDKEIRQLGDQLIQRSTDALKLQDSMRLAAIGLRALSDAAGSGVANLDAYGDALRALANIGLPDLDDRGRAAAELRKAMNDAEGPEQRRIAQQAYDETIARIGKREAEREAERKRREAEALARRGVRSAQADEDAFGRAITTAQGRTRQLEEEARLVGVYSGEVEAARLRIELETAAKKRGLDISADMQRAIDAEVEGRRAAVAQLEAIRERQEALNQAQQYFGDIATDALSDLLIEGKSVEDVFNNIAKSIANAALQAALMGQGPLAGILGLQGQNGAPGGLFGALFDGLKSAWPFANGGIMTEHGSLPLNTYAKGGIANSPQLALYGEGRMPEAYVPLPDGRSIPVTMQGMPAPANNNSNFHVTIQEGPGVKVSRGPDGPQGPTFLAQVDDAVANALLGGQKTGAALKHLQRNRMGGR